MLVAMKRGLGHIQGYRSAEKHLMLIYISLNNKIYMVLKWQTKMQTSYRSALNTTGSPTTTQCPRLEIEFSYVECSESVSVLLFMHVFIEYLSVTSQKIILNLWHYGTCQDILKEQRPRCLLAKNWHICGANCFWDITPVILWWLHQSAWV